MRWTSGNRWGICAIVAVCALSAAPPAQARDFLSALFGAFSDNPSLAPSRPESSTPLPFASVGDLFGRPSEQARPRVSVGGGQAYCVRTCDGRYFPITAGD